MYHSDECWRCCSCCCCRCCWTFCVLPPINQQQSSLSLLCRRIRIHSRSCSFVVVIRRTIIVHKHTRLNTHIFCMYHRTHMRRLSALFEHSFTVYLLDKRTIQTNGMTDRQTERARDNQQFSISTTKCVVFDFFVVVVVVNYLTNEWITEWQQQWSGGGVNGISGYWRWWRRRQNATTAITTCWICRQ